MRALRSGEVCNKTLVDLRFPWGMAFSLWRKFKQRAISMEILSRASRDNGGSFLDSVSADHMKGNQERQKWESDT